MVPLWSLAEMSRDSLKKKVLYNSDLSLMQPSATNSFAQTWITLCISYQLCILVFLSNGFSFAVGTLKDVRLPTIKGPKKGTP